MPAFINSKKFGMLLNFVQMYASSWRIVSDKVCPLRILEQDKSSDSVTQSVVKNTLHPVLSHS